MTVDLPEELAARLAAEAAERGVSPEALVVEAIEARFGPKRRPGFIGIGRSGHTDTSERHKEIRREAFADKTAEDAAWSTPASSPSPNGSGWAPSPPSTTATSASSAPATSTPSS